MSEEIIERFFSIGCIEMLKIRQIPMLVCIYRLSNALSNEYSDAKTALLFDVVSILFPHHLSLNEFLFCFDESQSAIRLVLSLSVMPHFHSCRGHH